MEYTLPEFRGRVKEGFNIVVAGEGFGVGSSREQAVTALLGKKERRIICLSCVDLFIRLWC